MGHERPDKACCVPLATSGRAVAAPRSPTGPTRAAAAVRAARFDVVELPGGAARVGTDEIVLPMDGEGPARRVQLRPFAIARHAVRNADFAAFVDATGYATEAERFGWSCVFRAFADPACVGTALDGAPWWVRVDGAFWRAPEGPASDIGERMDHPVVHVSWNDAAAYAAWAGGRLPTEAEWEHAARGGAERARFPWGDREPDDEVFQPCNIWQGPFPERNTARDGYVGTAPVDAFAPNGYGLRNMAGNTWEWCADAFRVRSLKRGARDRDRAARRQDMRLLKGGSYLCHRSYCYRYRIAARTGTTPDSATGHVGFRLAYDPC